ncbi:MAG: hypothetical protein ABI591_24070 [Kofleriaceae bacterium]
MWGALLAVTLAVAACGNDHGVTLIIHPNRTDVTQVRLYIGVGDQTVTDLTDDSMVSVANVWYWTRDPGNELDLQDVTNNRDVVFNYDTSDTIPVVIAVGYDGQGQPVAAGVADTLEPAPGHNDFTIYEITLAPADPFSQTSSSAMQLGLWSPMTTDLVHASCAGIIDATKSHPYFVVLDNDQDCDGYLDGTAVECTPDIFHGTRGAGAAEADCLYASTAANGAVGTCQLGGSPCTDATPATTASCQPGTTCLPTGLCTAGVCPATHPADYACAADLVTAMVDPAKHAHYACTIPLDPSGAVCSSLKVELDRPPTGGYDCTDFAIGDSMTVLGGSIKQNNVTFSADHLDTAKSCSATLSVNGMPMNATQARSGLVDFTLNNTGGVAIPIVFTFDKMIGCNAVTRCVLDVQTFDDASQTRCAAGWQPAIPSELATSITNVADPTLTDDLKTMFYVGTDNLYTATKTTTGWTAPTSLNFPTAVNRSPEIGANGAMLLYTASTGAASRGIFITTRTAVDTPFGPGLPLVDSTATVFTAATFAPTNPSDAAGIHHLFAAGTQGGGTQGLYDVAYTAATSTIDSVTPITIANGPTNPDKPHLTPDGLQLYFEGTAHGAVTLYVASRTTIDDAFTYAVELPELSTPNPSAYTGGAWVAPNGRTMYFTQTTGQTVQRIYVSTRANL